MIRFERVWKRFPERGDALKDLSFELASGEMAFLTGHSGAGKSTLLRLIGLMDRPSRGQILVNRMNISELPARKLPYYRRQIGMIFQDHRLLQNRTVFDNVALPLIVSGMTRKEIGKRVRAALDQVGLLRFERALPITLSGGEQQRVGIARAVVARPPVILADEPTGNLDPDLSREIFGLFERFHDVGVTLLIATHNIDIVSFMQHRIIRLHEGRLDADSGGSW
ncbi:cell division ATP-binding protein FtsE [Thiorhodovibrio frisius]|uniref:Cell division ATP-binding protein FtsE n=1 Tax=Thiorhodovibrio frisius TaxID=631362 RepID=H8Z6J7_9GAMM|nr:cell division ATP-binding protein FtsE [Thiorhodovibrio frisius]EIC19695.1 cell division ATP-binding protein FtsE [Thiorhodovibrio frisius]WPL20337.1 Cell division ATP-binding protein FtsE [Thiorhodovibrio frisius]